MYKEHTTPDKAQTPTTERARPVAQEYVPEYFRPLTGRRSFSEGTFTEVPGIRQDEQ